MTIRPATPADAAGIAAIWNPIIAVTAATFTTEEKSLPDLRRMITSAPCVFVACSDQGILGFALYDTFRNGPGYAKTKEVTIYLAPEARKLGYGSRLLTSLEDHARDQSIVTLVAGIGSENIDVEGFFKREGFSHAGRLPGVGFKFDRWMDLILMTKRLA